MDKRLDFTGGNPDIRLDQILIDSGAHRPAIHALLNSLAVGTNTNFIIQGCVATIGGSAPTNTYSITAGYIYLNGEVLQVDSLSGSFDSGTNILAYSKQTTFNSDGDINYNDATPRQTWQVNRGIVTEQASVSGTELDAVTGDTFDAKVNRAVYGDHQEYTNVNVTAPKNTNYITFNQFGSGATRTLTLPNPKDSGSFNKFISIDIIRSAGIFEIEQENGTSILSGIEDSSLITLVNDGTDTYKIFKQQINYPETNPIGNIKMKLISIGDWNMDTSSLVSIAHGLTYTDIRSVYAAIITDDGTLYADLTGTDSSGNGGGIVTWESTDVILLRTTGGAFDNINYNATSFNRGYITIQYV